jgi:hypothetical protein
VPDPSPKGQNDQTSAIQEGSSRPRTLRMWQEADQRTALSSMRRRPRGLYAGLYVQKKSRGEGRKCKTKHEQTVRIGLRIKG